MKNISKIISSLVLVFMLSMNLGFSQGRIEKPFNDNWGFYLSEFHSIKLQMKSESRLDFTPPEYKPVTIPHTWNDNMVWKMNNNQGFYQGIGWYMKDFDITPDLQDKRIFLRFEAVGEEAWLYVNGEKVGYHGGAYSAFCFEITKYIHPGKNRLHVRVSNLNNPDIVPNKMILFPRFGGIYRPVKLIATNKVCISPLDFASSGVYVTPIVTGKKQGLLKVKTLISNSTNNMQNLELRATLKDHQGRVVLSESVVKSAVAGKTTVFETQSIIKNPHLWNGKQDPYLYTVLVEVIKEGKVIDTDIEHIGFRTFRVDPEEGAFLNGKYINIVGTARHQDYEKEGVALSDAQHKLDIDHLLELGATGVRLAHYQQSHTMYDLCDQTGLLCWAEIPLTPGLGDKNPKYVANAEQQVEELVKQNYNHPSIFVWNIFNEVRPKITTSRSLNNIIHSIDSLRYTCNVCNYDARECGLQSDLVCRNSYPLWYTHDTLGARLFIKQRENYRSVAPDKPMGISEYGAGGDITQHMQNPTAPNPTTGRFFPEEYENEIHEGCWKVLKDQKDIWCKFLWNLNDFGWTNVTRGSRTGINNKGLITYDRKTKKDVFYFYKANWNNEVPTLYLTSRRHVNRTNAVTDVKVYSNCTDLTLFVNGEKISTLKSSNDIHVALWKDITLSPGINNIEVKAFWNKKLISDHCTWVLQ